MKITNLVQYINPNHNTLLISPIKYHDYIYQQLLSEDKTLFNISLLDINSFLNNMLLDNNIDYNDDSILFKKLNIYYKLKKENHQYTNSINYIDELVKLENECNLSNIELNNEYGKYLNTKEINFNDFNCQFDEIIILSKENLYPIHDDLFKSIPTKITDLTKINSSNKHYYEHNNTIKMLDYIIYDIYSTQKNNILIICDDLYQQDYLKNKFYELGISHYSTNKNNTIEMCILSSIFALLDNNYSEYDIKNLSKPFDNELINELLTLNTLDYKTYLIKLYDILYQSNLFEINYLNNIFKELYLNDEVNLKLLNKLMLTTLTNKLKNTENYSPTRILISTSDYNSFEFEHVYLVDASMPNFKAKQTSYLLNTNERKTINPKLITNSFYSKEFNTSQNQLLNCGTNIYIHYSLLNIDNKPQTLAYFISSLGYSLNNKQEYFHLTTHDNKVNKLLLNNDSVILDKEKIITRLNNKITLSATALDSFYQCYYKYFVNYLLRPNSPNEFNALSLGNIYHNIIEEINKLLIAKNSSYKTYNYDELLELVSTLIEQSLLDIKDDYSFKNIKTRIYESLKSFIDSTIYFEQYSKYRVSYSELSLSTNIDNSIFDNVSLYGKVDALMSYQNSHYILDYKSSSKDFNKTKFKQGINNQLIVYLYLLKENDKDFIGAFYQAIKDNYIESNKVVDLNYNKQLHLEKNKLQGILLDTDKVNYFDCSFETEENSVISTTTQKKLVSHEQLLEYFEILTKHIKKMLEIIDSGHFRIEPINKDACKYCDYKFICKISEPQAREDDENEL